MKKFAAKFEKLFPQRMLDEGLTRIDRNRCSFRTEECILEMTFGMFYYAKSMKFNSV